MSKNIFIKSMLRQKLRTLLLFALLTLAAFGFVMRTVEYLVVRDQIMETAEFYQTTGFINHQGLFGDVSAGVEMIAASPYVLHVDSRRAVTGFVEGIQNVDVSGLHNLATRSRPARYRLPTITETYFYAYFVGVEPVPRGMAGIQMRLVMLVDEVVVGHPEYIYAGHTIYLDFVVAPGMLGALNSWQFEERYFIRAAQIRPSPWELDLPLEFGVPVPNITRQQTALRMWPLVEHDRDAVDFIWYVHAPDGESVDFSQPDLEHLPAAIAYVERNQRTVLLQTVHDMRAIPQMTDTLDLHDGRWITRADYVNANHVAVIDWQFANARNLNVGDTITVDIPTHQTFTGHTGLPGFTVPWVRVDYNYPERYNDTTAITLEIVGITRFTAIYTTSNQSLFVFIPDSVLPGGIIIDYTPRIIVDGQWYYLPTVAFGADYIPDTWFNFTLADSRYYENFMDEFMPRFVASDMNLVMHHMDSTNFWISATPVLIAVAFNAILFWVVLLLVIGLCTFLYLRSRARDMAIKRALGASVRSVYAKLVISVVLFALPATIIGGVGGWVFALNEAGGTLAAFEDEYTDTIPPSQAELFWQDIFGDRPLPGVLADDRVIVMDVELSTNWLILMLAIAFVLIIAAISFSGLRALKSPVLALLQGNVNKGATKSKKARHNEQSGDNPVLPAGVHAVTRVLNMPKGRPHTTPTPKARFANALFFIRLHIQRSKVRTALGISIAALFVFAMSWLQGSIITTESEIDRLYDTTIVRAQISGNPLLPQSRYVDDVIMRNMINTIMDTGYALDSDSHRESAFLRSFVIAPENDAMPSHWFFRAGLRVTPVSTIHIQGIEFPLLLERPPRNMSLNSLRLSAIDESVTDLNDFFRATSFHNRNSLDFTLGVSDISAFLQRNVPDVASQMLLDIVGDAYEDDVFTLQARDMLHSAYIRFADGYDERAFDEAYSFAIADAGLTNPLPIIISLSTAYERGLELGDHALLAHTSVIRSGTNRTPWPYIHTKVIGIHNEQIHTRNLQEATLIPYWAFEELFWPFARYTHLDIAINPAYNRDLFTVRNDLNALINPLSALEMLGETGTLGIESLFAQLPLQMNFNDAGLRNAVAALGQILILLELLFPVAAVITMAIGAVLATLLVMQNTKNAAILRTTGTSKQKTRIILFAEQMFVCLMGFAVIAPVVIAVTDIGVMQMLATSALYVGGAVIGSAVGAVVVTRKAPLDLLQVRE